MDVTPKINPRENTVYQQLRADGYEILRNGAPDFMIYKTRANSLTDIRAVEVKSPTDSLSDEQEMYRKILETVGIPYEIRTVHDDGTPAVSQGYVKTYPKRFERKL